MKSEVMEHHVVLVVRSAERYVDVMCSLVAAAKAAFGSGVMAAGYDPKKIEKRLQEVTEERNLAVAECHKLRCEQEAARVSPPRTKRLKS